jgi:hypothetical protein
MFSLTTLGRAVGLGHRFRWVDVGDVYGSRSAAQAFRHGDLGALDRDVARNERIAGQRTGHRQAAAQRRHDEAAVGITRLVEIDPDVGGEAGLRVGRNRT